VTGTEPSQGGPAPLRVLISSSTFPIRPDDGLPRFVYDLGEALAARCVVTSLVPAAPGAPGRERMGGVEVRRFTYFLPPGLQRLAYGNGMRDNLRVSLLARLQPPPFVVAQAWATRSLCVSQSIDVVNSHWMIPQGLSTALARGRRPRFGHVLTVHAADVYMLRSLPFGASIARFVLGRSDAVFADGSHVRDSLDALAGRPSGARIQPNGVSIGLFREPSAEGPIEAPFAGGYLLFTGRLAEKKGATYLLQALPKLLEQHPDLGLVVIGYGALEGELRREAGRLGIGDAVRFLGRQPHAEIGRWLRGARLAVVPSIVDRYGETEGMPTVVIEAMAAGTRVVGSAVDGIPDVIRHGENGWLCRPKDPADLAEKILLALQDPPDSELLQRSLATAERFAWPEVAAHYLETFEQTARLRRATGVVARP
jgi:glycosyltransferase involved in cell wall biosynthesis